MSSKTYSNSFALKSLLLISFFSFTLTAFNFFQDVDSKLPNLDSLVKSVKQIRSLQEEDSTIDQSSSNDTQPVDTSTSTFTPATTPVNASTTASTSSSQSIGSSSSTSSPDQSSSGDQPSEGYDSSITEEPQPPYTPSSSTTESEDEEGSSPLQPAVITKKKISKVVYAPELVLLTPKMRLNSNTSIINESPCGGTEKQAVHYLTKNGSRNYVQWRVIHPSPNATCIVKIGNSDDKLNTLQPRDGSADSDGAFICAREIGYEGKEFIFPESYNCDDCTFQFVFNVYGTYNGAVHQCSDMMIGAQLEQECAGKCQNLGDCVSNVCQCRPGYSGTYCEVIEKVTQESTNFLYSVFIVICLTILGLLVYCIYANVDFSKMFARSERQQPVYDAQPITGEFNEPRNSKYNNVLLRGTQ